MRLKDTWDNNRYEMETFYFKVVKPFSAKKEVVFYSQKAKNIDDAIKRFKKSKKNYAKKGIYNSFMSVDNNVYNVRGEVIGTFLAINKSNYRRF